MEYKALSKLRKNQLNPVDFDTWTLCPSRNCQLSGKKMKEWRLLEKGRASDRRLQTDQIIHGEETAADDS